MKTLMLIAIIASYVIGSLILHNFLWNVTMHDNLPQTSSKKSDATVIDEIYGYFLSLHIMALLWPLTLVLGMVVSIVSVIRGIISPK